MRFIDFDKGDILKSSKLIDGFYEYLMGSPVEVTSIKSRNKNSLISSNLSSSTKEDKLMIKYSPTNKVYFSEGILTSDIMNNFVSCKIDTISNKVYIGELNTYGNSGGILVFSGYLSLNKLVEEDRPLLCTQKMISTIMDKIRVLSIGVRGDKLYGLFYIPAVKGLRLSIRGSDELGISPITLKSVKCNGYSAFTIKDWFDKAKINER